MKSVIIYGSFTASDSARCVSLPDGTPFFVRFVFANRMDCVRALDCAPAPRENEIVLNTMEVPEIPEIKS